MTQFLLMNIEVPADPPLRFVQVPQGGIPAFRYVKCTTQFHVTCKLAEAHLDPTACVIDRDVEEHQAKTDS